MMAKHQTRTGFRQQAHLKCLKQPGAHQRGLATARGAGHREEAMSREAVDHCVDLPLASEKNVSLVALERPQARIGGARHRRPGP
jgi:hypothetical protein